MQYLRRKIKNAKDGVEYLPCLLILIALAVCIVQVLFVLHRTPSFVESQHIQEQVSIANPSAITYPADGVSPNKADIETLCLLPGVGEVTAQAFIDEREKNGAFVFPEDLLAVKGIGNKKLENIRSLITLP